MKTEIIPVIHMLDYHQVVVNVNTCLECGIEKVFIINHQVSESRLLTCAYKVKEENPKLWVGVNLLNVPILRAVKHTYANRGDSNNPLIDGLWCDETMFDRCNVERKFKGMLFTGVAFKYQPQPSDLKEACRRAKLSTDVATTSGPGTGEPADVEKIKLMRKYLGDHPMAIASGVSVENIDNYKGLANYLLVASSITDHNEMIIKEKLIELKSKLI